MDVYDAAAVATAKQLLRAQLVGSRADKLLPAYRRVRVPPEVPHDLSADQARPCAPSHALTP
eukprot:1403367-Prymnesium_polylepis.1